MTIANDGTLSLALARRTPDATGLTSTLAGDLRSLFRVWNAKARRNVERSRYYHGHNSLKDLGIAIPPSLTSIETVVSWPQRAVDSFAVRSRLNAFTGDESVTDELDGIAAANDLYNVYRMAVVSELTHSCAAMTVTRGADGTPVIRAHSATTCAMLWDWDRHRIRCGVTVADVDEWGQPRAYNLYEDDCVVRFERLRDGWSHHVMSQPASRPLMEPLIFRASLDRPFGMLRISRAVMSITDSAVRTALRSEISAEFFTSPQKYLLGAPEDLFEPVCDDDGTMKAEAEDAVRNRLPGMTKWEAYLGSILAVTRDEEGNVPTFGQLAAASMEPHIAYMRNLAARFSGATNVPISELGIVQDNPSSAEAIYAAKEALIIEAEDLNESNGAAMRNVARMALAVAGNKSLDALTREERSVSCYFMNPSRPSLASQTDAMLKQASVFPGIVRTRVYWEELGYRDEQIDEIMAQMDRDAGSQVLQSVLRNAASKSSDEFKSEAERG